MTVVNEKDWKYFRSKQPQWVEKYFGQLNQTYIKLLDESGNAVDKFYALRDKQRKDAKGLGWLMELRRSTMEEQIMVLRGWGVIPDEEFNHFSPELQDRINHLMSVVYAYSEAD